MHLTGMDNNHHDTSEPARTGPAPAAGLEPLLGVGELAAYLGVPVSTVYDWRTRGQGPPAHRFGKHLKFTVADVRAWVAAQRDTAPPYPSRGGELR